MDPHFDKVAISKSLDEICKIFDWFPATKVTDLPASTNTKKRSIEEMLAAGVGLEADREHEDPAHVYADEYFQGADGLACTTKKRAIIQQLDI